MNFATSLKRAAGVVVAIVVGLIAGLYIWAASRASAKPADPVVRRGPTSRPSTQPGSQPGSQPASRVDKAEVEKGEPFPYNHIE